MLLQDEKAGSSYSSVFEPEIEPRQNQTPETRDSLCIIDPVVTTNNRMWNSQTHGSDSGVSVHSDALQGDSFESNPIESSQASLERPFENIENGKVCESTQQSITSVASILSLKSDDKLSDSVSFLKDKSCNLQGENNEYEAIGVNSMKTHSVLIGGVTAIDDQTSKLEAESEEEEKEMTAKVIIDKLELPVDALYEESHTYRFVDDKHSSMHFHKLDEATAATDDEDDSVFAVGCKVIPMSQASTIRMDQMFKYEAEEHPEVKNCRPMVRHGSTDKRERVETSLRVCYLGEFFLLYGDNYNACQK